MIGTQKQFRPAGIFIVATLSLFLSGTSAWTQEPSATKGNPPATTDDNEACDLQQVYAVDAANLQIEGNTITVTAEGAASSAGWKVVQLAPRRLSSDHTAITYDLAGCPPKGYAAQIISRVSARRSLDLSQPYLAKLQMIVVRAKTKSQTLMISDFRK